MNIKNISLKNLINVFMILSILLGISIGFTIGMKLQYDNDINFFRNESINNHTFKIDDECCYKIQKLNFNLSDLDFIIYNQSNMSVIK